MVVEALEKKVTDSKKEISQAIQGQYADPGRTVEIKREKGSIYLGDKPIGTDGAYEDFHLKEKGIKLDYSKLFEHMGVKKDPKHETEESQTREQQKEERKGAMQPKEITKFVDETFMEEMMRMGNRTSYEDKERFYRAIMFSEEGVWFRFRLASAPVRGDCNFSLSYMLN